MMQPLFPRFSVPHFSLAPSKLDLSLESVRAAKEDLRLLVVSATALPPEERAKLWPTDGKVQRWYRQAAEHGVALVVVRSFETLEFYTTHQDRELACAQPLYDLSQRCQLNPDLWRLRVPPLRGMDAARHLFSQAAGIGTTRRKARMALTRLVTSAHCSRSAGALSPAVRLLFSYASKVASRVEQESLVGNPKRTAALREMEEINAARLIEEELLNWRLAQLKLCRALALSESVDPGNRSSGAGTLVNGYSKEEVPSGMRIRAFRDHDATITGAATDERDECLAG